MASFQPLAVRVLPQGARAESPLGRASQATAGKPQQDDCRANEIFREDASFMTGQDYPEARSVTTFPTCRNAALFEDCAHVPSGRINSFYKLIAKKLGFGEELRSGV